MLIKFIVLFSIVQASQAQIITVNAPNESPRYDVFEININHDQSAYSNVWWDVAVTAQFTAPSGDIISIDGFYYDTDTWMLRFAPKETGVYNWSLDLNGSVANGSFNSIETGNKGFIRQHPNNVHRWVYEADGSLFAAIGSTTWTTLHTEHSKINLSQDWDVGGFQMEQIQDRVSLEDYMTVMIDEAGHNLWRWSSSNTGYSLWDSIDINGNQYGVVKGQYTDRFFKTIRAHGGRVYFDLLGGGINDPTNGLFNLFTIPQQFSTTHYLRYVVARYAALVDFWQTSNEQSIMDNKIAFYANTIRQYDPYKHLISASWERPDHPEIDINSPHWYSSYSLNSDASPIFSVIENLFNKYTNFPKPDGSNGEKPLIFDEIGESIIDCQDQFYRSAWSPSSSITTRMKYWASFFAETVLISWDQSKSKEVSGGNYFDAELKNYIRHFANFTQLVEPNVQMDTDFNNNINGVGTIGGSHTGAKSFGLRSNSNFYAYISDPTINSASDIQITIDVPQTGQGMWYDPETGKVVGSLFNLFNGIQTLAVPTVQHDIALFIQGGGGIDTPPNAEAGADLVVNDSNDDGFLMVTLDGSNSSDTDGGSIQSWRWSIYGQTIGTSMSIDHGFKQGITPVTLSITDDEGNVSTDFLRVRVNDSAGNTPPFLSLKHGLTGDWGSQGSVNMAMFAVSEDYDTNGANHYLNNTYTWKIDGNTVATGADFWPCGNGNSQYSGLNKTATSSVGYGGHVVTVIADTGSIQSQDSELYIAYEPFINNNKPSADAGLDETLVDSNNDGKQNITLLGNGTDSDGTITGYFWYDGKDFLGSGQSFPVELSLGIHQITLIAVDNLGGYGDVRKVVIINANNDIIFTNSFEN